MQVEGPYVPNAGFLEDAVFEDPTLSSAQISDSYDGANDGSHDQPNGIDDKEAGQHVDVADVQSEPSSASVAPIDARNEIADEVTANVGDLKLTDDDSADQSTGKDQDPLSAEDVDMLLEKMPFASIAYNCQRQRPSHAREHSMVKLCFTL